MGRIQSIVASLLRLLPLLVDLVYRSIGRKAEVVCTLPEDVPVTYCENCECGGCLDKR